MQGMNDLFVLVKMESDLGEFKINLSSKLFMIFWNVHGMLRQTNYIVILADMTSYCQSLVQLIVHIIEKVSPLVTI
jgi:hypothetical protein